MRNGGHVSIRWDGAFDAETLIPLLEQVAEGGVA